MSSMAAPALRENVSSITRQCRGNVGRWHEMARPLLKHHRRAGAGIRVPKSRRGGMRRRLASDRRFEKPVKLRARRRQRK